MFLAEQNIALSISLGSRVNREHLSSTIVLAMNHSLVQFVLCLILRAWGALILYKASSPSTSENHSPHSGQGKTYTWKSIHQRSPHCNHSNWWARYIGACIGAVHDCLIAEIDLEYLQRIPSSAHTSRSNVVVSFLWFKTTVCTKGYMNSVEIQMPSSWLPTPNH